MDNNNINFTKYPKSFNHKISWTKKDNIKTCDLNPNCMELIFDIRQNKNVKIINDDFTIEILPLGNQIFDKLPIGDPIVYETFGVNNFNYEIISCILFIILFLIFIYRKN